MIGVRGAVVASAVVASAVAALALTSACTSSASAPGSIASHAPTAGSPGGTALALLSTLAVKGRAPKTGYSRAQFGASWTDDSAAPDGHNGCRTRDDILSRDLTRVRISDGCTVHSGVLVDPYTGSRIDFLHGIGTSYAVQIDHVVALGDAWQTGAQQWSVQKRTAFANDPLNLLAVGGSTNEAKGDSDAASWLPPNKAYRCPYVARQVAVKARYRLWVTAAERAAIVRVLSRCVDEPAPSDAGSRPSVAPRAMPSVSVSTPSTIVVYRNCAALNVDYPHGVGRPGAHDHTSGTPDTRFVVNSALYDANAARDGDHDGVACER